MVESCHRALDEVVKLSEEVFANKETADLEAIHEQIVTLKVWYICTLHGKPWIELRNAPF